MIKEYVYARLAGRRNIVNNNRKPQQASQKYNGTEVSTHCYCSGQKYLIQNILRYFQICAGAGVGGGGGGPQGWPPSLLRIGTASQHCSWPGCTLEREKSKTSKEAWGTSNVSYPIEPRILWTLKPNRWPVFCFTEAVNLRQYKGARRVHDMMMRWWVREEIGVMVMNYCQRAQTDMC